SSTISLLPFSAAYIRATSSESFLSFTLAPLFSSSSTIGLSPFSAAIITSGQPLLGPPPVHLALISVGLAFNNAVAFGNSFCPPPSPLSAISCSEKFSVPPALACAPAFPPGSPPSSEHAGKRHSDNTRSNSQFNAVRFIVSFLDEWQQTSRPPTS